MVHVKSGPLLPVSRSVRFTCTVCAVLVLMQNMFSVLAAFIAWYPKDLYNYFQLIDCIIWILKMVKRKFGFFMFLLSSGLRHSDVPLQVFLARSLSALQPSLWNTPRREIHWWIRWLSINLEILMHIGTISAPQQSLHQARVATQTCCSSFFSSGKIMLKS